MISYHIYIEARVRYLLFYFPFMYRLFFIVYFFLYNENNIHNMLFFSLLGIFIVAKKHHLSW